MSDPASVDPQHDRPKTPSSPNLLPPKLAIEDPGAHDLHSSDDEDDHFSDATEGQGSTSPIPITRIEKVDSLPSHGEVPGTEAYSMRAQDAVPDEVEVASRGRAESSAGVPKHTPIPMTVVEKVESPGPSHGDVPGTDAWEKRKADAVPDRVVEVADVADPEIPSAEDDAANPTGNVSLPDRSPSQTSTIRRRPSLGDAEAPSAEDGRTVDLEEYDEEEDGSSDGKDGGGFGGDDFDDFEEGADNADDDFGDFDEAESGAVTGAAEAAKTAATQSLPSLSLPVLDFSALSNPADILSAVEPYMSTLFPSSSAISSPPTPSETTTSDSLFLTERSASLYAQLLTPPPLAPPNWLRSRIRRLFLVSLGVPIDLDEILPASKQKKLVLPSTLNPSRSRSSSPSHSSNQKGGRSSSKSVKDSANRRRKGPPPAPRLDVISVRNLCEEEVKGRELQMEELRRKEKELDELVTRAGSVLEYWVGRREGAVREKEAFEGVIENLVMHARKVRK